MGGRWSVCEKMGQALHLAPFLALELGVVARSSGGGALVVLIVRRRAPTQPSHRNGMSPDIVVGMGERSDVQRPSRLRNALGGNLALVVPLNFETSKRIKN